MNISPKNPAPAFQLYAKELLSCEKVAPLTLEQVGALLLLLCVDWNATGIPADAQLAAKIIGKSATAEMIAPVLDLFRVVLPDGKKTHHKLAAQRIYQAAKRAQNSENARKGHASAKRPQHDPSAAAQPSQHTATPIPTEKNKNTHTREADDVSDFEKWREEAAALIPTNWDEPLRDAWGRWIRDFTKRYGRPEITTIEGHLRILDPLSSEEKVEWLDRAIVAKLMYPSKPYKLSDKKAGNNSKKNPPKPPNHDDHDSGFFRRR